MSGLTTKNNKQNQLQALDSYIKPEHINIHGLRQQSILLISAPPGYGKSALAKHLAVTTNFNVFWCDLENCYNEALLIHSLKKSFHLENSKFNVPSALTSTVLTTIAKVIHQLESVSSPLVVFSGIDETMPKEYWTYLSFLFAETASRGKLVVTCNQNSHRSLLHWVESQGGEIVSAQKLLLSVEQAQALIEKLPPGHGFDAELLVWPYAFKQAQKFLTGSVENADELKESIFSYFNQTFIEPLNSQDRLVLNAACLTDDFDIEFVVKTTRILNAPQSVKKLVQIGLLNKTGKNFSLKPYFKACVANEFQYMDWGQRKAFKNRAARYWASKKLYEKALSFCQTYELWESASDILLSCAEEYINAGQFEALYKWFEAMPSGFIDGNPLLMVYRAWCFPEYQKINGAHLYLGQIETLLTENEDQIEQKPDWLKAKVQLQALRGYICRIAGDFENALVHAQKAVSLANKSCPEVLSRLYITIGQDLYLKGDMIAAKSSLMQAVVLGKQYKKHHDVLIALGYAIAAMDFTGSLSKAKEVYQESLIWFKESGFLATDSGDLVNDLIIDIHRQGFEFDKALALSDQMVAWCESTSPALYHLVTYIRRYRLAISMDNREEAYYALTQAEAYREVLGVSLAFGWAPVAAMRAEYELRYGSLEKATAYFEVNEPLLLRHFEFASECERFIYAQWLAACDRSEEARNQLVLIRDQALISSRWLQAIKADVQLCLVLYNSDPARAILHLRDALKTVPENEDIIAPFLWFGKQILPMLDEVRSQLYQDFASIQLLNKIQHHASQLWPTQVNANILNVLSDRQVTILKLLMEGDQDKVIAKKLNISPGTVKTHLRAIYRKLNCSNRAQAVSIAMEQGLLLLDNQQAR